MNDIAIRIENLGKRYRIGVGQRHDTLRDALTATFRRKDVDPSARSHGHTSFEEFWALRDVSFEVKRGEVVGVIGRNGAGKSTLLKILSRITEPTHGHAEIHGRVGSLLEVGTGFHPELTGRENIYLNGAILGMKRTEIDRKFDEIVDFSGVERFLDTPVKRYSSGMYVRLAFAVAAHLEPEILLVDEVLAVGDAEFQRKCLGKMGDVAKEGRTVLFVSHNMASLVSLCPISVLLDKGHVANGGCTSVLIQEYLKSSNAVGVEDNVNLAQIQFPEVAGRDMYLVAARVKDTYGNLLHTNVPYDNELTVEIDYAVARPNQEAYVVCCFTDLLGIDAFWLYDAETPVYGHRVSGLFRATIRIPQGFLRAGVYYLRPSIVQLGANAIDYHGNAFHITIDDRYSILARKGVQWPSAIKPPIEWQTSSCSEN